MIQLTKYVHESIYVFIHTMFGKYNKPYYVVTKIGSTKNIISRLSTYRTSCPEFDINNLKVFWIRTKGKYNCYQIDNLINYASTNYSKPFPKYIGTGGTEFYHFDKIENLLGFFNEIDVKYYDVEQIDAYKLLNKYNIFNKSSIAKHSRFEAKELGQLVANDLSYKKCEEIISKYLKKNNIPVKIKDKAYCPRSYQIPIVDKCCDLYKTENFGRLYMPCGTGKTLVAYFVTKKMGFTKIFIVVPSLYLVSTCYESWHRESYLDNDKFNYLLVASDADIKGKYDKELQKELQKEPQKDYKITTNIDTVKKFIKGQQYIVVISTYHSSKLLIKACKETKTHFDFGIYDEAHRTVGRKDSMFNKIVTSKIAKKKIFMTATEKVYRYKKKKEDEILSMDDIEMYGKIIVKYSLGQAIKEGQLCDYKIVFPMITEKDIFDGSKNDLSDEFIISRLIKNTIDEYSPNHMLLFSNTNKKSKKLCEHIKEIYEDDDVFIDQLSGKSSMTHRKKSISEFVDNNIGIISSVKIFMEGADIPICDSVCFCDNKQSKVDIIQAIGRCLRLDPNNPDKIAYIIVPFILKNDDDDIFSTEDKTFIKLRHILQTLYDTDEDVTEKFILRSLSLNQTDKSDDVDISFSIADKKREKQLTQKVIAKVFDRNKCNIRRIRNKIVYENKRRYANSLPLIDTKMKCLNYLKEEHEHIIPDIDNWVEFCLGKKLFEVIKKKYYYNKTDLSNSLNKLNINDFEEYKLNYHKDKKLPGPDYINDGFFNDLDEKFNFNSLLKNNDSILFM